MESSKPHCGEVVASLDVTAREQPLGYQEPQKSKGLCGSIREPPKSSQEHGAQARITSSEAKTVALRSAQQREQGQPGPGAGGGRKTSKPRVGEVVSLAVKAQGQEMAERRGRQRGRGTLCTKENVFEGHSEIHTQVSADQGSRTPPPLQEEDSGVPREVKCQRKPLGGICRKPEKKKPGSAIQGAIKSQGEKGKDASRGPEAPSQNQKSQAAEPLESPPRCCDSSHAAEAKQALGRPLKGGQAPGEKTQRPRQENRKVTDYFPVRRSCRKSKAELEREERNRIDEWIESGKEEGMKIALVDGKGRGVVATQQFCRGDLVVEYHGDLVDVLEARKREAVYAQQPSTGCYMYYFQYLGKAYCMDATRETSRLGRLINHSKRGNCRTKVHAMAGVPHLIFIASRDIAAGEELLYDYGDRSKAATEAYPWLKH